MNYLGHLLITYPYKGLTMGNLLGDMLRARELSGLNGEVVKGVEVHHFIDRFTDSHKDIHDLVELSRPMHGKYAPVVVDILLDHVLALRWEEHAEIPYRSFADWVYYEMIPEHVDELDSQTSRRIRSMTSGRWLDGYLSRAGMRYVLTRMDCRTSFPSNFTNALDDFDANRDTYIHAFDGFYKELKSAFADQILNQLPIGNSQ